MILNGVSGLATLGMTLVLTGGGDEGDRHLTAYPEHFRPEIESEKILSKITSHADWSVSRGLQCVVTISVGVLSDSGYTSETSDRRRITGWALDCEALAEPDGVQML